MQKVTVLARLKFCVLTMNKHGNTTPNIQNNSKLRINSSR